MSEICIQRESFAFQCGIKFQLQKYIHEIFAGWKYLCRILSLFFPEIFFVKYCIEENTIFVATVNFPQEINSTNTTVLQTQCTFRCVKNRFLCMQEVFNWVLKVFQILLDKYSIVYSISNCM